MELPEVVDFSSLIEKALKSIFKDSSQTENTELFEIANSVLQEGLKTTFEAAGSDFIRENKEFIRQMSYNTGLFAAFKTHEQTANLIAHLKDEKGKLRNFSQFRKATEGIVSHHNKTWLKTEYNTAIRSARMAANWKQFEKTKHIYPNLEYMPSRSSLRRDEHVMLYGIILPIDHPFWDTHTPPTGWGCKCSIRASRKKATGLPDELPEVPPEFRFNPGKTAEMINTKEHAYYKGLDKKTAEKVTDWHREIYKQQLTQKYRDLYGEKWDDKYQLAELVDVPEKLSLKNKIKHIEKAIKDAENEMLFIMDKNGKVTARATGIEDRVDFDANMKGKIVIHNHPSGLPFSYNGIKYNSDIKTMIMNRADTFVVKTAMNTYTIKGLEKVSLQQFESEKTKAHKQALTEALKADDEATDNIYWEHLFETIAKNLNFTFIKE